MAKRKWITEQVTIRDAEILFPNFDGHETDYNEKGERNFCVIIPDADTADKMKKDLWNIKTLRARDEGEEERYYMSVNISYRGHTPPTIWMKAGGNMTLLTEDTVQVLQGKKFEKVDLIINPRNWGPDDGRHGVKGYVDTMYVTIQPDPFYAEYFGSELDDDDEPPFDVD